MVGGSDDEQLGFLAGRNRAALCVEANVQAPALP